VESKDLIKEKEINDSTAFAYLQKEIEKERKKTKTMSYIGASLLFTVAILGYLTFGPFQIPVLSHIGDSLLGREGQILEEPVVVEDVSEDTKIIEEEVAGESIINEQKEPIVEEKKPTTTVVKKTTVKSSPPPPVIDKSASIAACKVDCDNVASNEMLNNCQAHYNAIIDECDDLYQSYISQLNSLLLNCRSQCYYDYMYEVPPLINEYNGCVWACEQTYDDMVAEKNVQRDNCYSIGTTRKAECASLVEQKKINCYGICDSK